MDVFERGRPIASRTSLLLLLIHNELNDGKSPDCTRGQQAEAAVKRVGYKRKRDIYLCAQQHCCCWSLPI